MDPLTIAALMSGAGALASGASGLFGGGGSTGGGPQLSFISPQGRLLGDLLGLEFQRGSTRRGIPPQLINNMGLPSIFDLNRPFDEGTVGASIQDFLFNPPELEEGTQTLLDSLLGDPEGLLGSVSTGTNILERLRDTALEGAETGFPINLGEAFGAQRQAFNENIIPQLAETFGVSGSGAASQVQRGFTDLFQSQALADVGEQARQRQAMSLFSPLAGQLTAAAPAFGTNFASDIFGLNTALSQFEETGRARPLEAAFGILNTQQPQLALGGFPTASGNTQLSGSFANSLPDIISAIGGLGGLFDTNPSGSANPAGLAALGNSLVGPTGLGTGFDTGFSSIGSLGPNTTTGKLSELIFGRQ
jgi:hypothetical protein